MNIEGRLSRLGAILDTSGAYMSERELAEITSSFMSFLSKNEDFIEPVVNRFMGEAIQSRLTAFKETYKYLVANNHNEDNPLVLGDADSYISVLESKSKMIIYIEDVASCADDSHLIFILPKDATSFEYKGFYCACLYDEEVVTDMFWGGEKGDEHRVVERYSLETLKRMNYAPYFRDGRDTCHAFLMVNEYIDGAIRSYEKIKYAMFHLDHTHNSITD